MLTPFLRKFLRGENVPAPAPATVFETGENRWRRFERWPPAVDTRRLYLQPGGRLAFEPPAAAEGATEYVSDPAKPVPYAPRPQWGFDYDNPPVIAAWRRWLVEDQRFVDGRPDVATWVSEPLTAALTVRGPVRAKLFAETSGSDADWVVKLIDVFPDDAPCPGACMNSRLRTFTILTIGAVCGAGLSIGSSVVADRNSEKSAIAALPLEDLRTFSEVFGKVKADYVEPVEDKKLLENAIRGMLSGLDPHSSYLDKEEFKELQEGTTGEFGGLGIEVGMEDGFVKVISPIDDTPASRAGVKAGDFRSFASTIPR